MNKPKLFIFALVLSLGIAVPAGQAADPTAAPDKKIAREGGPGHRHGKEGGFRGGRGHRGIMAKLGALDVSDAQREQIRGVLKESRPNMRPLMKQYMQERRALREAIQATPVNEAAIRAQSARVSQVKTELDIKRAHMSQRIRAALTPEQVEKLRNMEGRFDKRMDAMAERMEENEE